MPDTEQTAEALSESQPPWSEASELTRALLLAQARIEPVVQEEVRLYRELVDDRRLAERLYEFLKDDGGNRDVLIVAGENFTRSKRRCARQRRRLDLLGVRRVEVREGDPFDARRHVCVSRRPAPDADSVGAVAVARSELCVWTDHAGQTQYVPVEVACYGEKPADDDSEDQPLKPSSRLSTFP